MYPPSRIGDDPGTSTIKRETNAGPPDDHFRNLRLSDTAARREKQSSEAPDTRPTQPQSSDNNPHTQSPGPDPARRGRKRLNQAQRRQMSAQLTIPIDPATPPPPAAPSSISYLGADNYRSYPRRSTGHYRGRGFRASLDSSRSSGLPQVFEPHYTQASPWAASNPPILPDTVPHPSTPHGWRRDHPSHYGQKPNYSLPALPMPWRAGEVVPHRTHGLPSQPGVRRARDGETLARQAELLDKLCATVLTGAEIDKHDIIQKEAFRVVVETLCRRVISSHEREHNDIPNFVESSIQLKCFGSLSSGFATRASDMDLGLFSPLSLVQPDASGSPIPRLLEKALLEAGFGARLLTRTRIPIIKLCGNPSLQLLNNLRKERERWDSGVRNEDACAAAEGDSRETEQQTVPGPRQGSVQDTHEMGQTPSPRADSIAVSERDINPSYSGRRGGPQRWTFKDTDESAHSNHISLSQAENQSISAYCGQAKRILRDLGGRELTASNYQHFTHSEYQVLADLIQAFVGGIRDEALRGRLIVIPAFQPRTISLQSARSLQGISILVEGEAILMQWEQRTVREPTHEVEQDVKDAFESWKMLRNKAVFGLDWIHHTKELQASLEKLKRFPSVQLVCIKQGQSESATRYSNRVTGLLSKLTLPSDASDKGVESEVLRKYISGVYHTDIRTSLEDMSHAVEDSSSFRTIVRRHKALQLAYELERALSAGSYQNELRGTVTRYVELLRGPIQRVVAANGRKEWATPITKALTPVLATIRHLEDPSNLSPNTSRDSNNGKLEFPKEGAGVQCDINFSAHLALINTLLLRCYSHTDPRVRPLVLFVKHWAKVRGINTPYRGTLSSYGYVLMVLHYLVNVAKPFVCPNLQMLVPSSVALSSEQDEATTYCKGRDVSFWRDEEEIIRLAGEDRLNQNRESVGELLRGFFEYYAHPGALLTLPGRGFDWGREVLSIRTAGGLLTKQEKGWTGAKTTTIIEEFPIESDLLRGEYGSTRSGLRPPVKTDGSLHGEPMRGPGGEAVKTQPTHLPEKSRDIREVRHRYLLAIEDPFELDHNVARTVSHNGIVSIRDEFRRAWRIVQSAGFGHEREDLLQPVISAEAEDREEFSRLLAEIHATTPGLINALHETQSNVVRQG